MPESPPNLKHTVTVRSLVSLQKDSLRLVRHANGGEALDEYHLEFLFDSDCKCMTRAARCLVQPTRACRYLPAHQPLLRRLNGFLVLYHGTQCYHPRVHSLVHVLISNIVRPAPFSHNSEPQCTRTHDIQQSAHVRIARLLTCVRAPL